MFNLNEQQTKDILDGMPRWNWGFYKTWDKAKNRIEEMRYTEKSFMRGNPRIKKCKSGYTISLIDWSKAYKEVSIKSGGNK